MWFDPITRYFHVSYDVPASAPDVVDIECTWSRRERELWHSASVTPLISETAHSLAPEGIKDRWLFGLVTERRAAGLSRTVVFDPYPDAQFDGLVDIDFRIEISTPDGDAITTQVFHLEADNRDVVYISDWSKVMQADAFDIAPVDNKWMLHIYESNSSLSCTATTPAPPLTYPLDLKGSYAIFVATNPEIGPIRIRLTGDERTEPVTSTRHQREIFWRWASMDREHLVLKQAYSHSGSASSSISYVKLVPLSVELQSCIDERFSGDHDRLLVAYFEPYTWAFHSDITETWQHREPVSAYKEAGVDLMDIQVSRFGSKAFYESRLTNQLLHSTIGDPIDGVVPITNNVGKMQQFTNTLHAELRYAVEMGIAAHANFGATSCYPGTPLSSEFAEQHPEWRKEHVLRYDVPEVRDYILSLFREALEIGAPGISIDFCRYPEGIDSAETCTAFMRELRSLADEFAEARRTGVPILVRFPAIGVTLWECFDYDTWVGDGLVDYLCPSNIQGVGQYFDIQPYVKTTRGTNCKLTPVIDALEWGPIIPGQFLQRVQELYDAGADGIYLYQGDNPILYHPTNRKYISLVRSSDAVNRWCRHEIDQGDSRSKGIYITPPTEGNAYYAWERLTVWLEGVKTDAIEMYLDGNLIVKCDGPPYLFATDMCNTHNPIGDGEHALYIRARDGDGWLEQRFAVTGHS